MITLNTSAACPTGKTSIKERIENANDVFYNNKLLFSVLFFGVGLFFLLAGYKFIECILYMMAVAITFIVIVIIIGLVAWLFKATVGPGWQLFFFVVAIVAGLFEGHAFIN